MRLYHVTIRELEPVIRESGFEDRSYIDGGRADVGSQRWGVWFSDDPVPFEIDSHETTTLHVEIPTALAEKYEVSVRYAGEESAPWREFLIPSSVVNEYPIESGG